MKLKILGTGSSGNCYLLSTETETLILDCGLPIKEIKRGLNFNISRVVGVLCSHEHKDHSLSVKDFENMGICVFKPYENNELHTQSVRYGKFVITPFNLPHNGIRNYGFMIRIGSERVLYLTDFEYCPYIFSKLKPDHILIECNYQQELVNRDLPNYEHKIRGHCSLNTCKNFVSKNATDSLKTVLLLHMGGETCDPEECVTEVQKVVKNGAYVDYARKGLEINLEKGGCPF